MTIATKNFVWQQGEDEEISLRYAVSIDKVKTYVDLTGYSLRMDIKGPTASYTINSDDEDPETVDEAVLNYNGVIGAIHILVPRSVSLPSGALEPDVTKAMTYDIFLRNPEGIQKKIFKGSIIIEASTTKWA